MTSHTPGGCWNIKPKYELQRNAQSQSRISMDAANFQTSQIIVTRPLEISDVASNYDVRCSVKGGGLSGQAGAIILGISKALIAHDENLKKNLKKDKLTTRDSRVVERKKYGHRKARRSFQFSKR